MIKVKEIQSVLESHRKWLIGEGGERANLSDANLYDANLRRATLRGADLSGATLCDANLRGATLSDANLRGAKLRGANLYDANLRGADLSGANLYDADLRGATLSDANLRDANLYDANLRDANLRGANLCDANLPDFQICPQEGSFVAYKKTTKGVIKLLIPEGSRRTNSLIGRKCRADRVVVLGGEGVGGTGTHYEGITYDEGIEIVCKDYDGDVRIECTKGIHFFMTLDEAENWS